MVNKKLLFSLKPRSESLFVFGKNLLAKVINTTPTARNTNPYIENSKKENLSTPSFEAVALTSKLVEVPIKVQLPPKIPANEIGIKSLEDEKLYFSDNCEIIFINMTTTAVVLINEEIPAETNINTGTKNMSGKILSFFID